MTQAPTRSVSRKRAHTETCHLAVFLGSGKPDAICIQPAHTTQSSRRSISSRRTQQRGAVPRIRFGLFAIHPEDVHRQRGRPAQGTEGHRIGTAQIRPCRGAIIIPRKCPPCCSFFFFFFFFFFSRTDHTEVTEPSDSARAADTRSSPFPEPGACTRASSRSRSRHYVRY
jgi:hypothetical protein